MNALADQNKRLRRYIILVTVFLTAVFFLPKAVQAGCCTCGDPEDTYSGRTFCIKSSDNCAECGNEKFLFEEGDYTNAFQCVTCKTFSEGTVTPEQKHQLTYFIPSITIPFSDTFNAGVPIEITGNTIGEYIAAFFFFFVSVAGILATVMIMYGGLKYVISRGNASMMSDAKDNIVSAVTGLILALSAYVILMTINPRLVTYEGFGEQITHIEPSSQLEEETGVNVIIPTADWTGTNVKIYDPELASAADNHGINKNWLKAIMLAESGGRPMATSHDAQGNVLACGLMQLLPSTAGVDCQRLIDDTRFSINKGAEYFSGLLGDACPRSATYKSGQEVACQPESTGCRNMLVPYAVAAYNGGKAANCSSITCPGKTWWECEGNPGYAETRTYVARVTDIYNKISANKDGAYTWCESNCRN
jgi:hypothetical protein